MLTFQKPIALATFFTLLKAICFHKPKMRKKYFNLTQTFGSYKNWTSGG